MLLNSLRVFNLLVERPLLAGIGRARRIGSTRGADSRKRGIGLGRDRGIFDRDLDNRDLDDRAVRVAGIAGVGVVGDCGPISDIARNASPCSGADAVKRAPDNRCSNCGGGGIGGVSTSRGL